MANIQKTFVQIDAILAGAADATITAGASTTPIIMTPAQVKAAVVANAFPPYVTTTNFSRTLTAVATTIPVTITVNGVQTVTSITKNANGEILTMVSVDEDINAITDYTPAGGRVVDAARTKTQSRIAAGGVQQNRTVTYNASNEIITIGLWA
jgi:hypothetical protein